MVWLRNWSQATGEGEHCGVLFGRHVQGLRQPFGQLLGGAQFIPLQLAHRHDRAHHPLSQFRLGEIQCQALTA